MEMSGISEDEIDEPTINTQLEEVLEFYDCDDLLPLAHRILWLAAVKETLGSIPESFHLEYMEIKALVLLRQEQDKKMAYENWRMKRESDAQRAKISK